MREEIKPSEETLVDVGPLAEAPPEEVQRAQAERLLKAWKTPTGRNPNLSCSDTEAGFGRQTPATIVLMSSCWSAPNSAP